MGRRTYLPRLYCSRPISYVNIDLKYSTILELYTIEDILELSDKTTEECLEFLVEGGFVSLPEVQPLDYD